MVIKSRNKLGITAVSVIFFIFLICCGKLFSKEKEVCLDGRVCCFDEGHPRKERGAKGILVVPKNWREKASYTDEYGNFRLSLPRDEMEQGLFICYYGTSCELLELKTVNVNRTGFEPEGEGKDEIQVYKLKESVIGKDCSNFEHQEVIPPVEMAMNCIKKPYTPPKSKIIKYNAFALLGGAIIAAMTTGSDTTVTRMARKTGIRVSGMDQEELQPEPGEKRSFLYRTYYELSQNVGFNFAPDWDLSEAVFWNPSATLLAFTNQASLYTDKQKYLRVGALLRFSPNFGIAAGLYRVHFNENGLTPYKSDATLEKFSSNLVTHQVAAAFRAFDKFYLGFSSKMIRQKIETTVQIETISKIDFDISFTYLIFHNLRIGINAMNILNSKLLFDNEEVGLFTLGGGIAFQLENIQFGCDIRREGNKLNFSYGVNAAIPIIGTTVTFGIAPQDNFISFGFNFKNLHYRLNSNPQRGIYHLFGLHIVF